MLKNKGVIIMDEEKQVVVEESSKGLTFKDILFIIRKHWIAIVAFILVGIAGGAVWAGLETKVSPVYQSSGIIMVSPEQKEGAATSTDYTFSNNLTNTVVAFIKTNAVLDNVKEEYPDFQKPNLSVSNSSGNLMITVKYSSKDPEKSKDLCQAVMNAACEEADRKKEDNTTPVYHMLNGNLNIVDDAKKGSIVSHTMRDLAVGLGAGVVLALAYVVIRELSDNTFKSSEEIERMLNIPVLAGIPDYHFDDEKKGGK